MATRTRCTVKIKQATFSQAIRNCEERRSFANLGDLWAAVVQEYKILTNDVLTPSVVALRVKEWNIPIKTVNGRNKAASIDKLKLQAIINEVEKSGPLTNRSALFMEVAKLYAERFGLQASHSTLAMFAQKCGLAMFTPKGKRGAGAGERLHRGPRRSRAEKFAGNPETILSIRRIVATTPERFLPVAHRVAKGSMRAAVQLKCLDCCCHQTTEIRNCTAIECALWPFRPYQNAAAADEQPEPVEQES